MCPIPNLLSDPHHTQRRSLPIFFTFTSTMHLNMVYISNKLALATLAATTAVLAAPLPLLGPASLNTRELRLSNEPRFLTVDHSLALEARAPMGQCHPGMAKTANPLANPKKVKKRITKVKIPKFLKRHKRKSSADSDTPLLEDYPYTVTIPFPHTVDEQLGGQPRPSAYSNSGRTNAILDRHHNPDWSPPAHVAHLFEGQADSPLKGILGNSSPSQPPKVGEGQTVLASPGSLGPNSPLTKDGPADNAASKDPKPRRRITFAEPDSSRERAPTTEPKRRVSFVEPASSRGSAHTTEPQRTVSFVEPDSSRALSPQTTQPQRKVSFAVSESSRPTDQQSKARKISFAEGTNSRRDFNEPREMEGLHRRYLEGLLDELD